MKTVLLVSAVLFGLLQSAGAFSPGGPIGNNPKPSGGTAAEGDAWQVSAIGYGLPGDEVAPKNLGEEYRRNLPVMYYACDANFLDYFAANGATAIDQACVLLNNSFTNSPTGVARGLDGYSTNLVEFPLTSTHFNYEAQALGMYDMKSVTMGIFMEQFGLADPIRYSWTLHDRTHVGTVACPVGQEYLVVQRNFDFISSPLNQLQASPYINNILYSYQIEEFCSPPEPPDALSVPFSADPEANSYSPVASSYGGYTALNTPTFGPVLTETTGIYSYGAFYTSLTRDDVGGLRYLISSNNLNTESVDASSFLFTISTNLTQQLFPGTTGTNITGTNGGFYYFDGTFGYGNYGWLVATSVTNSPAVLQALYPGLVITSSSNYFVLATNWIYTQYFTNLTGPGTPYPPPLTLVTASNPQPYLLEKYVTTFANVFPNKVSPTTTIKQQVISVVPNLGAPYPAPPLTNVTTKTIVENIPSGDFFLLSPFYTNYCPLDIIRVGLTNVQTITNILTTANTNLVTATNTLTYTSTLIQVGVFTNYTFVIDPVTCTQSGPPTGLYQGIEKIQLVKSTFDSLLSQTFQPITNNYSLVTVTNSQAVVQHFQRIVTTPDFLFSAEDLTTGPGSTPSPVVYRFDRNVTFDQANAYSGLAGPGTITTPTIVDFNKSGPAYYNGTASFIDVLNGTPYFTEYPGSDLADTFFNYYFAWGSFDATTNAPAVYPDGASIDALEDQVLIQVTTTPAEPLIGSGGQFYSVQFAPSGGAFQAPYTWSATGLPPGLSVTSNPDNTATLSGTPTAKGSFVFTLTLMDSLGRSVQWSYSITIQ